ncbi:hypothetical protein B5181_17480 [Streptomyces sp. 4F]|nr:hypothetical protein B5181_17480 [Streptomyces sp. 4F]
MGGLGPGPGGFEDVVRQRGEPGGGSRTVGGGQRVQQVPEPGEDVGRCVAVDDEPGGVAGLGAPSRHQVRDGGDVLVPPVAAGGHHLPGRCGSYVVQGGQDLRPRAPQDVPDRAVGGPARPQWREAGAQGGREVGRCTRRRLSGPGRLHLVLRHPGMPTEVRGRPRRRASRRRAADPRRTPLA